MQTFAVLAVVSLLGWRLGGSPGALTGLVLAVLVPPLSRRAQQRRSARRYDDHLLVLLRALARSLRSGATLRTALHEAGDTAAGQLRVDLAVLADDLDNGVTEALHRWAARRPASSVQLVAGGLALGYSTGGITAAVVDSLADTIRLQLDGRDETAALATQATLSAVVLAAAPLCLFLVGALGESKSNRFLVDQPAGRICLVSGLALDALSLLWMLRMVRRVDR